jgi:hypothetical protein
VVIDAAPVVDEVDAVDIGDSVAVDTELGDSGVVDTELGDSVVVMGAVGAVEASWVPLLQPPRAAKPTTPIALNTTTGFKRDIVKLL